MSRRSVIGMVGLVGLGVLAARPVEAVTLILNGRTVETGVESVGALTGAATPSAATRSVAAGVTHLSSEASHLPGSSRYAAYLSRLKLGAIDISKLIESHVKERGGVHNTLPPTTLWRNMVPTLRVADAIARALGEEVEEVISAYRSPAYNRRCPGGASNSQHMRNGALDLVFASSPSKVARVARALRDRGLFKGGVGQYSGFTHVDTRGTNADW